MALTCLVTIHGIGFQQPPREGVAGYADGLHEHLREGLGASLGDDPNRDRGPVYVQSTWPPETQRSEAGMERLGTLNTAGGRWRTELSGDWQRLAAADSGVAHVALVYSHLEEEGPDHAALADVSVLGLSSITHYATLGGLVRMAVRDLGALLHHHHPDPEPPAPTSLRVRTDVTPVRHNLVPGILHRPKPEDPPPGPTGLLGMLRQIEDDVAAYVARNELRERLRAFVREALTRLLLREDVARVVVNGHSNGTVVAFDVLSQLPPPLLDGVSALVTAGSPLRKYVELLGWGTDAANLRSLPEWLNFWDERDPVADPLEPPVGWRRGQARPDALTGLFTGHDPLSGEPVAVPVRDIRVDNVENVADGGGLPAHDYWDNRREFCIPLAALLGATTASTSVEEKR
ncbi:MAG: hypothetical protein E6J03_02430 [Chloroflexi bacterium]|nr:MAG: hypothetical protein E6J03_02430 [Chloroflexota bacterium]